jgi:hypothetical protein
MINKKTILIREIVDKFAKNIVKNIPSNITTKKERK